MKDEKTPAEELREKLFASPKHTALRLDDSEIEKAFAWCEGYKDFLGKNKILLLDEMNSRFSPTEKDPVRMLYFHYHRH